MESNIDDLLDFIIDGIKHCKVLVIGDIMLDQYYYGEVQRISPEAPVPVVKVTREEKTLGGAANVAHNLSKLGCKVLLAGVTGDDINRQHLCEILEDKGVDHKGLVISNKPTITKTRVIGGHQQMVRLDIEEIQEISDKTFIEITTWFLNTIKQQHPGVVILSDYGKGVCTPALCELVIRECNRNNIPVVIDPKGKDWEKYRNADIVTPNYKELSEIASKTIGNSDTEIETYANIVKDNYKIRNLLVTRSEMGMSFIQENSNFMVHIPTHAREVFDVSGAGDTVIATLAAFMSGGFNIIDAVKLSNIAAGIVVGRVGTYAITGKDLRLAILNIAKNSDVKRKIFSQTELLERIEEWRQHNNKIIFTNGCFDILHAGHIDYLEKARKLGDRLIIALNKDISVKKLKGESRPIINEIDRANILAALEFVDAIIMFEEETPEKLIRMILPNVIVKGGDYSPDQVIGKEYADEVVIIPYIDGYSTSNIIKKILDVNTFV